MDVNYNKLNFYTVVTWQTIANGIFNRENIQNFAIFTMLTMEIHHHSLCKGSTYVTPASRQQGLMGNVRKNGMYQAPAAEAFVIVSLL